MTVFAVQFLSVFVSINLQFELCCIVTGSCRPFKRSVQTRHTYEMSHETDEYGELLVAFVFP